MVQCVHPQMKEKGIETFLNFPPPILNSKEDFFGVFYCGKSWCARAVSVTGEIFLQGERYTGVKGTLSGSSPGEDKGY